MSRLVNATLSISRTPGCVNLATARRWQLIDSIQFPVTLYAQSHPDIRCYALDTANTQTKQKNKNLRDECVTYQRVSLKRTLEQWVKAVRDGKGIETFIERPEQTFCILALYVNKCFGIQLKQ